MKVTIQNLTNSAIDLPGGAKLFAHKEWEGELDSSTVTLLEASPALKVTRADAKPKQETEEQPETEAEETPETGGDMIDELRAEYERLADGKKADKRWGEERLIQEIEALDPQ